MGKKDKLTTKANKNIALLVIAITSLIGLIGFMITNDRELSTILQISTWLSIIALIYVSYLLNKRVDKIADELEKEP